MPDKFSWDSHYDVGIYGWWGHENFGGALTYFALSKVLSSKGFSVLMIQEANGLPGRYSIPDNTIAMSFAHNNLVCSPQVNAKDLARFNDICDRFIIGGDQVWNYYIPFVKEDCFLNFVDYNKTKISYSSSLGPQNYNPPKAFTDRVKPLIKRFDSVSVREDYAVGIAKRLFDINATQVLDAIFLTDKQDFVEAAVDSTYVFPKKFLFAFILNPTKEKRFQVETIANKLGLDIVCCPDAAFAYHKTFNEIFLGLKIIFPLSVSNLIKAYEKASYIVTDSYHGTCLSYVFHKHFSVYYNEKRGMDRFISLMNILKLESRRIYENYTEQEIFGNNNVNFNVDWTEADLEIQRGRDFSISWLLGALTKRNIEPIRIPSKYNVFSDLALDPNVQNNRDFKNVRLVCTLLRDYGVKHVVLSPGCRAIPLIRMFENNTESFILHRVTDERSAAYYAMGLATQLQKPVACVCTSGTAASNYLPAVTEAYYTGIPLIVITGDRYSVFLNQNEDQTIPQKHIYSDVVKMEITLPEANDWLSDYKARRDISACILETTHNGFGPVHINIPVYNITIGADSAKMNWTLLPFINPHLQRVSFNNGTSDMLLRVNDLKKSKRILIVYGQNVAPNDKQKRNIELFASKYNCVILTDHISNLNVKYSMAPYNMLQSISQAKFNENLTPDILISVGGRRLLNDPLLFKIRDGSHSVRHWLVNPDGQIRDLYFRLTSVFETTQDYFFEFFAENAGNISNNGTYYEAWKNINDQYGVPAINRWCSIYVQSKFLPSIPRNSILHLAVGQSFYDTRQFRMDDSIEVYCNMGTNGIDGCTSTFMGQCAVVNDRLCFLLVGDLSFFYDMNSIWNKPLKKNIRILLVNNNGTDLLKSHNLKAVTSVHNTKAEGWVCTVGFEYISANTKEEFEEKLKYFVSDKPENAVFFEVFCP
ncbi:MAG: 2-succinyl-5-enolpyruvyl-6-hydroxy-3-cyclohexene-1-carboxylic-acid synthase [Prevotella sp.]|nr:2-succinyl-5-enolpyruvyl-6-hydroxy-3-cyclohexene-1-carboxylic-acid synthase [Prevotella sp.]